MELAWSWSEILQLAHRVGVELRQTRSGVGVELELHFVNHRVELEWS